MYDIARILHSPKAYACKSCGVIWFPSEHGVRNLLITYGPQIVWRAGWPVDHAVVTPCSCVDHITPQDAQACNLQHCKLLAIQPVPWKMRLGMIVEMQIEILNGGEILVNCKTKITIWIGYGLDEGCYNASLTNSPVRYNSNNGAYWKMSNAVSVKNTTGREISLNLPTRLRV